MAQSLQSVLRKIHKKFGRPSQSVTLIVKDMSKSTGHGFSYLTEDGWVIEVDEDLDYSMQVYILIHEYAHTMTPEYEKRNHGPAWGIAYSTVYSWFFDGESVVRKVRKRK